MTRRQRSVVFALAALGLLILVIPAARQLPVFGTAHHPLRDLAVSGSVAHQTANAVSSVNFDQRAFDTFGEELILLASVAGVAALLRPTKEERERSPRSAGTVLPPVRLLTYVMLPLTAVIGADVVIHGQVTPGGGFQGGIILATGLHLLYVGGTYETLERLRPLEAAEVAEAVSEAAYVAAGLAGLVAGSAFLADVVSWGRFGDLLSGGTVPVLSIAVGVEVASGVVLLLADFLRQALMVRTTA